ncbi:stabilizer of axonemal microtubules 1 [Ceratina calcarata]|uniref:Stabilizer of axonemal microtubules 1 n=1 Tax=Ceratina calcarata TaxID=156304 RepID=A0AAJ7SBT2_9HYME|nr:stabilizer of axonemal microtubules 1 [Ceratina calcarata]
MQICKVDRTISFKLRTFRLQLDHDDTCNCCCCCTQRLCYKYVQPEVPKSFAPIRHYWKSNIPMEDNTTYKLSYWENPCEIVGPILPRDWLVTGDGPLSDETTYRNSYFNYCGAKPETAIVPCDKQWLGRGPMQDVTTQKHDFTWKNIPMRDPIIAPNNIYCQPERLSDDTTYRLSYFPTNCYMPAQSYAPLRQYAKPDVPMEDYTTYRLSYYPNDVVKDEPAWDKQEYIPPTEPMDGCTTYRLSYWPHCERRQAPIIVQPTENLLNAGCCTENNTTYRLSYFGCGGDKPDPIVPPANIRFSNCPLSYDTVHRMSFLGNWCVKPETPITPCDKQWLGRGPMQDVTTQKHDFTWKNVPVSPDLRREDSLATACAPFEKCTTYKLSYINNDKCLLPLPSYAPDRTYRPSDVPMTTETIMQLSYQPVDGVTPVDKPWAEQPRYQVPTTPMDDNTTYNCSYMLPGTLVPICPTSCPQPCPCPCPQAACQPC